MLPATKQMLEDERVWGVAARVAVHADQESHFAVSEGQIQVSVITLTHNQEIWAILPGGSRTGAGWWRIPDVRTEVFVMFSGGEFEGDAYIAGFYGRAPGDLEENVTLILDDKVEIRAVDGTAHKLALLSELQTLYDFVQAQFNTLTGHVHATPSGPTTTITLASGTSIPPDPVGTSTLKAE